MSATHELFTRLEGHLNCDASAGSTDIKCFANFSHALLASESASSAASGSYRKVVLDYSKQVLSTDSDKQQSIGKQLAAVGKSLEEAFKGPQDVEGAIEKDQIYVVQTRPQP